MAFSHPPAAGPKFCPLRNPSRRPDLYPMSSPTDGQGSINSSGTPLDSSGHPLDNHNTASTIIKAATTVSLILLGLALMFTILKVTTWLRAQSEYSRLREVKARVSHVEYLDHSDPSQAHLRSTNPSSFGTRLVDAIHLKSHRDPISHQGSKKLRNLFDIQEYEGTPA